MEVFRYERAKQLIDERGLKRRWVAERIGMVHGSFTRCLIGKARPGRERVERLAALLGVSEDELWTGEANRRAHSA